MIHKESLTIDLDNFVSLINSGPAQTANGNNIGLLMMSSLSLVDYASYSSDRKKERYQREMKR